MTPIITITFNPALDKSVTVPELISEKKLKCSEPVYEPGGGGLNVARALKKLGGDATAMYLAGGFAGAKIDSLLSGEGINTIPIHLAAETRENIILADLAAGKQYLLDMPGPFIRPVEWRCCLNQLVNITGLKYIVVSGSMPPGIPDDIFSRLAFIAWKKKAKLIVDTSGRALQLAFDAGAYMLKPNLRELARLAGVESLTPEAAPDTARKLLNGSKCETMVVSLGAEGAIFVTDKVAIKITPPSMPVKSTVGAGDSLVAGIIYKLADNHNLLDAVCFGVACGTAATLNPGTELCRKADAEKISPAVLRSVADRQLN